jgi:hypothetical protein
MVAANTQSCSKPHAIEIGRYNFERVDSFSYHGSLVTGDSNVLDEITNRLRAANTSYFGQKCQLKSQLLSRKTKILTYKTLVRLLLTYTTETWTVTVNEEGSLSILERKILHRIYGPICERERERERARGQKRCDTEIKELYSEPNIVNIE